MGIERLLAPLGVLLLASCSSTWYGYHYSPSPMEARVTAEGEPLAEARSLITVLGIARDRSGRPPGAVVRLRVENVGTTPVTLERQSLDLVAADLRSFRAPRVELVEGQEPVPPAGRAIYELHFPLPGDESHRTINLDGLNFKWTLLFGERSATTGVTFDRVLQSSYYDSYYYSPFYHPYYYPRSHVHVGFVGSYSDD